MARSVFYNQTCGRRFSVSLLALEYYATHSQECVSEDDIFDVFMRTVVDFCGVTQPTEEDVNYFSDRLNKLREEVSDTQSPKPAGAPKKTFGSSYDSYLQKLSLDSTIMRMVGYDIGAARRIYCEMDRDDAMKLVNDYVKGLMEESLLQLEATMYGFGGKYKGDKKASGESRTHDLNTEEGKAALKRLKFI